MELLLTLATAATAVALWWWVVPRVSVADPKAPDFAALISPQTSLVVGLVALVGSTVFWRTPELHWWLWWPYLAFGAPMIVLDALTTYLPKQLNYLALGAMTLGSVCLLTLQLSAWVWAVLAALAAFSFFYLVYHFSRAIGFGDVRLAVLVGAVAGQGGFLAALGALLLATLVGAAHGLAHGVWARRASGRPAHFAYGPSMWIGPILWALLSPG